MPLEMLEPLAVKQYLFVNLLTATSGHCGEGVTAEEMADYDRLQPGAEAEIKSRNGQRAESRSKPSL